MRLRVCRNRNPSAGPTFWPIFRGSPAWHVADWCPPPVLERFLNGASCIVRIMRSESAKIEGRLTSAALDTAS